MALFKDTVALEACPAKTAESVSYAATFTVLGWLILSNYSSLGYAEIENAGNEVSSTVAETQIAAEGPTPQPNTLPQALPALAADSGAGSTDFLEGDAGDSLLPEITAWHASLQPPQQTLIHPNARAYSAAAWEETSLQLSLPSAPALKITDLRNLTVPMPGSELSLQALLATDSIADENAASDPIREITVTGSETDRLMARPDNILRPQIPRPYRAQDAQRALLLPPRIQALRP